MDALNLRASFVLIHLIAAGSAWFLFSRPQKNYLKWALWWLVIVLGAYLARNIWIFMGIVALVAVFVARGTPAERIAAYFLLLPAIPSHFYYDLPGLVPGIRYWFEWTYPRMLCLAILLPLLRFRPPSPLPSPPQGGRGEFRGQASWIPTDAWVFLYIGLALLLAFRGPSLTGAFRSGFTLLLDFAVPYYVISRSLEKEEDYRQVFLALIFSAVILCLAGLFEELKHWRLYGELDRFLGISSLGFKAALYRQGILRVTASFAQPIVFGFFTALALSALVYLKAVGRVSRTFFTLTLGLFASILLFALSRGPWLGTFLFLLTLAALRPRAVFQKISSHLTGFLIFAPLLFLLFLNTPLGGKVVRLLPFVGVDQKESIDYRVNLAENAAVLIRRHPLFGTPNFLKTDHMEALRTTEGIIDVVNTYAGIALEGGLVSLFLFGGIFLSLGWGLFRAARADWLGAVLLAQIVAVLFMIGTVSSIAFIPVYTWAVVAWAAAYLLIKQKNLQIQEAASR